MQTLLRHAPCCDSGCSVKRIVERFLNHHALDGSLARINSSCIKQPLFRSQPCPEFSLGSEWVHSREASVHHRYPASPKLHRKVPADVSDTEGGTLIVPYSTRAVQVKLINIQAAVILYHLSRLLFYLDLGS